MSDSKKDKARKIIQDGVKKHRPPLSAKEYRRRMGWDLAEHARQEAEKKRSK